MGFPKQSTNHAVLTTRRKPVKIILVRSRGVDDWETGGRTGSEGVGKNTQKQGAGNEMPDLGPILPKINNLGAF